MPRLDCKHPAMGTRILRFYCEDRGLSIRGALADIVNRWLYGGGFSSQEAIAIRPLLWASVGMSPRVALMNRSVDQLGDLPIVAGLQITYHPTKGMAMIQGLSAARRWEYYPIDGLAERLASLGYEVFTREQVIARVEKMIAEHMPKAAAVYESGDRLAVLELLAAAQERTNAEKERWRAIHDCIGKV